MESRNAWAGRSFMIPFYIGLILFFIFPLIQSVYYSLCDVKVGVGGYNCKFSGLANFKYIFTVDVNFNENLITSLMQLLYRVPVILISSLLLALIIKSDFKGRTFVRACFFLPVVLNSGVLSGQMMSDIVIDSILKGSQYLTQRSVSSNNLFETLLSQMGMNSTFISYFNTIFANLFSCLWLSGVQTIIFLTGLQKISPALYEASSIEGASAWDNFWKITIPMLKPIMLFVVIFTIVETFTERTNKVMSQVLSGLDYLRISQSAAMAWVYSVIIFLIVGIVVIVFTVGNKDNSNC